MTNPGKGIGKGMREGVEGGEAREGGGRRKGRARGQSILTGHSNTKDKKNYIQTLSKQPSISHGAMG